MGSDHKLRALWAAVDALLGGASLPGIGAHKLGPLAAERLRRRGEPVPQPLMMDRRAASIAMIASPSLLQRVRASCDGPLVLMKGPEVARLYPGGARRFGDVDILTDKAADVHRALIELGFVEQHDRIFRTGSPRDWTDGAHHTPLATPESTTGLQVEVHESPRWPSMFRPPSTREILEASGPSSLGVDGISAPAPLHHALIIAAHAWHHEPLWTLRDLIDIAAISAAVDKRDLRGTAAAWGIGRLWRTTERAIEGLFYGGRDTLPLRTWARHLGLVRDRTRFEKQVAQLAAGYWGMPPHLAPLSTIRVLRDKLQPAPDESWRERATRVPQDFSKLRGPAGPRGE